MPHPRLLLGTIALALLLGGSVDDPLTPAGVTDSFPEEDDDPSGEESAKRRAPLALRGSAGRRSRLPLRTGRLHSAPPSPAPPGAPPVRPRPALRLLC